MVALALLVLGALGSTASAAPVYRTPGYAGTKQVPRVAPVPPPPPVLLGPGIDPHLLVDAAGTGHVAFASPAVGESVLHYCRLPRGQKQCSAQQSVIPPDNDGATGNGPQTDEDLWGPYPLAVGNELLVLDHRCCNHVDLPDGTSSDDVNFLYTSEDGGATLTGPGLIGTQTPSGNALVYGGADPHLGVISDTQTGGTFFQGGAAGAFTKATANLGNVGPDAAYSGRLALDGDRPIAAFGDLTEHVFVREYSGSGDVNDPANWSTAQFPGESPQIAGGPGGVWVAYQTGLDSPWLLERIVGGQPSGPPLQITPNTEDASSLQLYEDASGRLSAGWINRKATPSQVLVRNSSDGVHWSAEQLVASAPVVAGHLAIAAAQDGGGFAAFEEGAGGSDNQVAVGRFGTTAGTGQQGLGNLDGGGLGTLGGDQLASASCTDVHFGAIDALAQAGCFLRDPTNPASGAAVTDGEIRLNGLQIIPDAGVRIIIDPRQHTINTTGSVSVVLRAPVVGDITIWHGELHVNLAGNLANAGQNLFDFDSSAFPVSLEGFPIQGKIDVRLLNDAVDIPISLKLPPYLGSITGAATLHADNAHGFDLKSLHIGVPDLNLGALEIKNLAVDYTEQGQVWQGGATVYIPGGTPYFGIAAAVEFDHGDLTMGSFNVFLPFPGAPIFTDAYLSSFGGGFDLHPPSKRFFGTVTIGAIPLDPPNYTATITGTLAITFTDNGPVVVEVDGTGALHGFQIASAKLLFQTNGYFEVDGNVDLDLDVVQLKATLAADVDLPGKSFSSQVKGELQLAGYDVLGADAVLSSKGAAACASELGVHLGFSYPWGGSVQVIGPGLGSCDLSPYVVQPVSRRALARGRGPSAHTASAGVAIASGTMYEDIAVTGAGGPPSVVLTNPAGQPVTPAGLGTAGAPALALPVAQNNTTYVMLPQPAAGTWTVAEAPGSAAITAVAAARGFPAPAITAHVAGRGGARRLVYQVPTRPGLAVSFAEQAHGVYHVLGDATAARGVLRFAPAPAAGGPRSILAIVSEGGIPREREAVASYVAPAPPRPGRVRGLHVAQRGGQFRISFGRAPNAVRYVLRISASDGRQLVSVLGPGGHVLTLPALGYRDQLTASVLGRSALDVAGPAAVAHAGYQAPLPKPQKQPKRKRAKKH